LFFSFLLLQVDKVWRGCWRRW